MKKSLLMLGCLSLVLWAKPSVSVSILPQTYFLEQIAGDTIDVNLLVKPGSSPATYEPKPSQMKELEKSDIYFAMGVPYESVWMHKFRKMFPDLRIVKTQKGIKKLPMKAHTHGGKPCTNKDHHHGAILDPHIWLDPVLVKVQAKIIASALIAQYPQHKAFYEKNLQKFLIKLDKLDEQIKAILKGKKGKKFLVFHPSWGYFANRYGLIQKSIEVEGKEPKPKTLAHIIEQAKKDDIKLVFVAPEFSQKSAKVIAEQIGGSVVSISPLNPKWEEGLLETAKVLANSLK